MRRGWIFCSELRGVKGIPLNNARSDNLDGWQWKGMQRQRCIVPASGFWEPVGQDRSGRPVPAMIDPGDPGWRARPARKIPRRHNRRERPEAQARRGASEKYINVGSRTHRLEHEASGDNRLDGPRECRIRAERDAPRGEVGRGFVLLASWRRCPTIGARRYASESRQSAGARMPIGGYG